MDDVEDGSPMIVVDGCDNQSQALYHVQTSRQEEERPWYRTLYSHSLRVSYLVPTRTVPFSILISIPDPAAFQ